MRVATTVVELSEIRDELAARHPSPTVAFVPTMGALHAGHRSLFRVARNVADVVVVSIFVNPLQFGPDEDYARYPRVLDHDLEICSNADIDVVFAPSVAELYPSGRQVTVSAGQLGCSWEGRSRPGHFDGVLTVVTKLFNIVRPDKAIFGQEDVQQVAVIRKMAADLNLEVDVVAAPAVREDDGLLVSTRNRYLLPHERTSALALSAALRAAAREDNPTDALTAARSVVELAERNGTFALDYLALVHPTTFAELPLDHEGDALMLVAGTVGDTRLSDNAELTFAPRSACVDQLAGPDRLDDPGGWESLEAEVSS